MKVKYRRYHKLVRDKVPENIAKEGIALPSVRTLSSDEEFFLALKKKFIEEARELIKAKGRKEILNEVVDLQDLIDTIISHMGVSKFEFANLQRKKNKKKGGFKNRLFLISIRY